MAAQKTLGSFRRCHLDGGEICRQVLDFSGLFWRTKEKVLILVIETGERANDVARVGSYAELGDPADVDGNLH